MHVFVTDDFKIADNWSKPRQPQRSVNSSQYMNVESNASTLAYDRYDDDSYMFEETGEMREW